MTKFYDGCFFCFFEGQKMYPEKCFECSCPKVIKQNWLHSLGLYYPRFQKQYQESKWSRAIGLLKKKRRPLIVSFSMILTRYLLTDLEEFRPCLITGIPSFVSEQTRALFRECSEVPVSQLLLASIAEQLKDEKGIEIVKNLVVQVKGKSVKQRSCKSDNERRKNVQGIYTVTQDWKVKTKNVILIDDVVTSGATLIECAKLLYEAGAAKTIGLTLARTSRKDNLVLNVTGS